MSSFIDQDPGFVCHQLVMKYTNNIHATRHLNALSPLGILVVGTVNSKRWMSSLWPSTYIKFNHCLEQTNERKGNISHGCRATSVIWARNDESSVHGK